MDKEKKDEIISTVESDANLDNRIEFIEVCYVRIFADIAYQLTRIANRESHSEKFADDVSRFIGEEICGGYEKPTWEPLAVNLLREALAEFREAE